MFPQKNFFEILLSSNIHIITGLLLLLFIFCFEVYVLILQKLGFPANIHSERQQAKLSHLWWFLLVSFLFRWFWLMNIGVKVPICQVIAYFFTFIFIFCFQRQKYEELEKRTPFKISPSTIKSKKTLPSFLMEGHLDSAVCQIEKPFTGEITVKSSAVPIKSIELQLVRVETCGQ